MLGYGAGGHRGERSGYCREFMEMAFKAMGLNELPNRMSRVRGEGKALNHLALNVTRSGREKEITKRTKNDEARRQGANEERVMSCKASEENISRKTVVFCDKCSYRVKMHPEGTPKNQRGQ